MTKLNLLSRVKGIMPFPLMDRDYVTDQKSLLSGSSKRLVSYIIHEINELLPVSEFFITSVIGCYKIIWQPKVAAVPHLAAVPDVNPDPHRLAGLRDNVDANTKAIAATKEVVCHA